MSARKCLELAARLEQATAPDKELGREVLLASGWHRTCVGHFYGPMYHWSDPKHTWSFDQDRMPCPTASVDMALRTVPPHHLWEIKQGIEARAIVWALETDYDDREVPVGYSTTFPATALCIAALKARAELEARTESAGANK